MGLLARQNTFPAWIAWELEISGKIYLACLRALLAWNFWANYGESRIGQVCMSSGQMALPISNIDLPWATTKTERHCIEIRTFHLVSFVSLGPHLLSNKLTVDQKKLVWICRASLQLDGSFRELRPKSTLTAWFCCLLANRFCVSASLSCVQPWTANIKAEDDREQDWLFDSTTINESCF